MSCSWHLAARQNETAICTSKADDNCLHNWSKFSTWVRFYLRCIKFCSGLRLHSLPMLLSISPLPHTSAFFYTLLFYSGLNENYNEIQLDRNKFPRKVYFT